MKVFEFAHNIVLDIDPSKFVGINLADFAIRDKILCVTK